MAGGALTVTVKVRSTLLVPSLTRMVKVSEPA